MVVTMNPSALSPLSPEPLANPLSRKVDQTAGRPEDLKGVPQGVATGATSQNAAGAPALPPPDLTAVDMMLQLTALMGKVADLTASTQEESIKNERVELKLTHEKRMADMKVFFDKMAESQELGSGFFARIVRAASSFFKGDMEKVGENLGQAFAGNPGTAITCALALMGSPVAGFFVLTAFLEDEACIYELARLGQELTGKELSPESHEEAKTVATVAKWAGVGLKVTGTVAVSLAAVVVAAVFAAPTGGATLIAIPALVGAAVALCGLPTQVEGVVRNSQATAARAEGYLRSAEADKTKAETEAMMNRVNRDMSHLQEVFDGLSTLISSLGNLIRQQAQGSASAARTQAI